MKKMPWLRTASNALGVTALVAAFLIGINADLEAQALHRTGIMPSVNLRGKLSDAYDLNFNVQSRFGTGSWEEVVFNTPEYQLVDLTTVLIRKVGLNSKLAAGYVLRLRETSTAHRIMQQYVYVRRFGRFRLGHRFRADQTWDDNDAVEVRLRYRLSTDFPLSGAEIDPQEFYIKVNNEYLNAWQEDDYGLEVRVAPALGFLLDKRTKFELGVDYRLDRFVDGPPRHTHWLTVNIYRTL